MTTSVHIHAVDKIAVQNYEYLDCGVYTRTVTITNDKGEEIEIILFSKKESSLVLFPVPDCA